MAAVTQTQVPTAEYFESLYLDARGDAARIPWADQRPHPALLTWLDAVAPSLVRCGGRVAVVGCGLGDDARELITRGYEVTAFDCSPTAIRWAQRLDPANANCYIVADLFDLPSRWRHRFDLVVEVNTFQSLLPEQRPPAMAGMFDLISRHGHLLVICRGAEQPVPVDEVPMPWALTKDELLDLADAAGLAPVGEISTFHDDQTPPVRRMRAVFEHQT